MVETPVRRKKSDWLEFVAVSFFFFVVSLSLSPPNLSRMASCGVFEKCELILCESVLTDSISEGQEGETRDSSKRSIESCSGEVESRERRNGYSQVARAREGQGQGAEGQLGRERAREGDERVEGLETV